MESIFFSWLTFHHGFVILEVGGFWPNLCPEVDLKKPHRSTPPTGLNKPPISHSLGTPVVIEELQPKPPQSHIG